MPNDLSLIPLYGKRELTYKNCPLTFPTTEKQQTQ